MEDQGNWDLTANLGYSGIDDPRLMTDMAAVEAAVDAFVTAWQDRTEDLGKPKVLVEAMAAWEALRRDHIAPLPEQPTMTKPNYFAWLLLQMNRRNAAVAAVSTQLNARTDAAEARLSFFPAALSQIDASDQEKVLSDPDLQQYRPYLTEIFRRAPHRMSPESEQVFVRLRAPASDNWFNLVLGMLSGRTWPVWDEATQQQITRPYSALQALAVSANQQTAADAIAGLSEILGDAAEVATQEMNSIIQTAIFEAELRNYPDAATARFIDDGYDPAHIQAIMDIVSGRFSSLRQFYGFKAQLLGVPQLTYWQHTGAYGTLTTYTPQQGFEAIRDVLQDINPGYAANFTQAWEGGRVDVPPRSGKSSSSATWAGLVTLPSFFQLTFTGQVRDIEKWMHEAGHDTHYSRMREEGLSSLGYTAPTSILEATALFVEAFVVPKLLDQAANDEERLALRIARLNGWAQNISRVTWVLFEQDLYAHVTTNSSISTDEINQLFAQRMAAQFGDAVTMESGEHAWIGRPQLRLKFYDFSYFLGLLIALRLIGDSDYRTKLDKLVTTGGRLTAPQLLSEVGIDMADPAVWNQAMDVWQAYLDETIALARQLGKIS